MSLRRRLLLTLAPLFVVGLVIADAVTYESLQSFLTSRVDDQAYGAHVSVERDLDRSGPDGGAPGGGPGGGAPVAVPQYTFGAIVSSSGAIVASHTYTSLPFDSTGSQQEASQAARSTYAVLPAGLQPGTETDRRYYTVDGTGEVSRYRMYAETVNGGSGNFVVVAIPIDDLDSTLARLLIVELAVSGGVTLAVVAATWLIVRRGMRPLERMGETARSIVASDLSKRVSPSTERTEVGRLGLALNTMLGQLEAAFAERARNEERLRHFVSDASHELRTPLTSMQGYAELLRRQPEMEPADLLLAMRRIEEETQRMGVLVDDLLLLARLDQGRPLERARVDLEALVRDAAADARAADPGRTVTVSVAAPLVVDGDEMRLRQVLGNVVRNALVHTPAGTPVELRLQPEAGRALVDVVDHGPGIPSGHAGRIFERFHRAEPGRSRDQGGSGLGLSIAAAVVAAHGGTIDVLQTPGGGATFRIRLPLAAAGELPDTAGAEEPPEVELPANREETRGPV